MFRLGFIATNLVFENHADEYEEMEHLHFIAMAISFSMVTFEDLTFAKAYDIEDETQIWNLVSPYESFFLGMLLKARRFEKQVTFTKMTRKKCDTFKKQSLLLKHLSPTHITTHLRVQQNILKPAFSQLTTNRFLLQCCRPSGRFWYDSLREFLSPSKYSSSSGKAEVVLSEMCCINYSIKDIHNHQRMP